MGVLGERMARCLRSHPTPNKERKKMTPLIATKPVTSPLVTLARILLSQGRSVQLVFIKKDGTERTATITRNLSNIPVDKHPKFVRADHPDYICGFDEVKGDWIRFHKDQLVLVHGFFR